MIKLENLKSLSENYKIVIPTTMFNEAAPFDLIQRIKNMVKASMAKEFGGYTENMGIGGYVAENGQLIEEQVYIVESYYKKENDDLIFNLAEKIKTDMNQESVLVEKNGKKYFL